MNICLRITIIAAATACVFATTPAMATHQDHKDFHGSDCQVFGATAWTDLAFSGYGVKNLASSARNVICPIMKDGQAKWDSAVNYNFVRVYLETGGVSASATCTVYVTTLENSTESNAYAVPTGILLPNTAYDASSGYFNGTAASGIYTDKAYMLCTLGPQVRLKGYYLWEEAETDGTAF